MYLKRGGIDVKYENVKFYDEKTKALTLVTKITDEEKREVEVKKYSFPFFAKGQFIDRALDLGAEFEEGEQVVSADLFERLTTFIVELYSKQFSNEELVDGINSGDIIRVYISVLFGVLQGDQKND